MTDKSKRDARAPYLKRLWEDITAALLAKGWVRWRSPQDLMQASRVAHPTERYQVDKRQTRFTYGSGPMFFLAQQIVKAMEDAGYPAEIHECHRPGARQHELWAKGRFTAGPKVTNARAYESAHQYWEGVDIIHPERGWNVGPDFWDTLAVCVETVALKYGVVLEHGHTWKFTDSAHVELADWRKRRRELEQRHGERTDPTKAELWERFREVLPDVARRFEADHGGAPQVVKDELVHASAVDELQRRRPLAA